MNYTPAPTFIASVVALFRKRTPQPTFTPAAPAVPTQVFVTSNTLTYVDPPTFTSLANAPHAATGEKRRASELPQHTVPETPRAPHRTTFVLPDWNTTDFERHQQYFDDDRASCCKADFDGHEHVCRLAEADTYAAGEPRVLGRMLFLFGFLFPPFWIAGLGIMLMPLRIARDWEQGKSSKEIEMGCTAVRDAELRWAKRCLVALVSEAIVILLLVGIVKWGVISPV